MSYADFVIFKNRRQAGKLLAVKLTSYRGSGALILGLARGGVMVASELGKNLGLSLDVLTVKKISGPGDPELAIGALAPDEVFFIDWKLAHRLGADEAYIKTQIRQLADQIKQKTLLYRKGMPPFTARDKTIIMVDDGAATGATLEAAIRWLKKKHVKKIVVAIPVAPADFVAKIKPEVSELVILETPGEFGSVGQFYEDFPQIEDEEVIELLH